MSVEANKQIIHRFFNFFEMGDAAGAANLIDDAVGWWVLGTGLLDKKAVTAVHAGLIAGTGSRQMRVISEIAEGDKVAAEIDGHFYFHNGRVLDNSFHIAFTIRDGKIIAAREYLDTAAVRAFQESTTGA